MKSIFSLLIVLFSLSSIAQNNYSSEWQEVDSLSNLGQSQTALNRVIQIYDQTKASNQADQFVKASLYRMKLEADFQEDYFEKTIERTQLEIQTAKAPVRQILHSILAELYWRYYQINRWQIHGRSETSGFLTDDIKTWDLKKLVSACMENYALSLSEKDLLRNTELTSYSEILIKQKDSEKFRPTLFDFLAYRAIDFYSSTEAGLTKPANTFLMNSADYFDTSGKFAALNISSPDTISFEFLALQLYQEVISFHLEDKDPAALIDTDLERLSFVLQKSILPEKDSLYLAALDHLKNQYKNHQSSTEVAYEIAVQLSNDNEQEVIPYKGRSTFNQVISEKNKWDKKQAVEICQESIKRFPDSFGANNCRSLIESIKQSSLSVTTNYATIIGKPSLALVNYRNVPKVYFRILKMDPENNRQLQEKEEQIRLEKYLDIKPERSWEQALPDDGDYRNHSAEVKIPEMSKGFYVLLSSSDASFPAKSVTITANSFWVSNISYLSRDATNGITEIVVLNRESGQALSGVKVQPFYRDYNSISRKPEISAGDVFVSDQSGMVSIPSRKDNYRYNQFYLRFSSKEDQLITESYFSSYSFPDNETKAFIQTHFFTDRAIYRPGQAIYFKGIVLERKGDDVKIKNRYKTEVTFSDANGQLVSKLNLTTNEFGSFAGSFTAPQGVLTGTMIIACPSGLVSVQVEEYKRPKFEVVFDPVKGSYKLGEMITIKGKATAYAGSTISDAKVNYRVVRQAHFPYYGWSWRGLPASSEMEITNGETVTGSDGSFDVTFKAIPDFSIDRKTNPVFSYTVYADVADLNGESHSAETSVSVGTRALLIKTDLEDEINLKKGFQFSLSTTNLNGEKQNASGNISIFKLRTPEQVLYSRKWQRPDKFTMTKAEFEKSFPGEVYNDEDDVTTWAKESTVYSGNFNTPADSLFKPENAFQPGMYLIEIKSKDAFGEELVYKKYVNAFQPQSGKAETVSPVSFRLLTPVAEPGQDVQFLIGTPLKKANVIYEIIQDDKVLNRVILSLNKEQKLIRIPVKEEYRGNFSINMVMVKNNRSFMESRQITVPYTNKTLDIQFATFRNKLLPGQEEEWQITLRDYKGEKVAAEMLAGMYDASLDAFVPHNWAFNIFNSYYRDQSWNDNQCFGFRPGDQFNYPEISFPSELREYDQLNWFGFGDGYSGGRIKMMKSGGIMIRGVSSESQMFAISDELEISDTESDEIIPITRSVSAPEDMPGQKTAQPQAIQIRKDFNETAFFFPQLSTNENGEVVIKFKAPEALTRWKMMGLAYTKDLKYGQIEKTLVTQKDLMIFSNAPRFLREGDTVDFSAKISNISDRDLTGTAELHFFDALTMKPIDQILNLNATSIPFTIRKGISLPVDWQIGIPEGLQAVIYRITATSGTFSDGEEAAIPVLTNRMLVTESMPLPVNGMQTKKFNFEKLINSGKAGSTLRNYRLSLEYTSNPAWYAVQALPYLMEYPYECAEQLFSRYYANSLASHIANSDPKIKRIFESWKSITPDALKSNLEKNTELKSVLLQESPWVRQASSENERKQRMGLLFDLNRMASEQNLALKKLQDMQNPNGGWPWFAGMPESRYITQHIVTGLGHLYDLKVLNPADNNDINGILKKAINYLDESLKIGFEKIKKEDKDYLKNDHLAYEDVQYLYARTYFSTEFPIGKDYSEVLDYYKAQSVKYWKTQNNYMKAMMALYLNRFGEEKTASLIMRSLKETALHSEEMGMYWRNEKRAWYWYQAPVETQALLIEAFDEVSHDQKLVEEMKIWLLKQKQTQNWKTTKATTEAVYALLLRGTSLLSSDKQVEITVGKERVDPYKQDGSKPEAGTGYFKTTWEASAIQPEMGNVSVKNTNPTAAWGAMYWQYFEQLDKITSAQTPLSLNKKLFREVNTPTGPVIEPITEQSSIEIGDKIVVRVELRTDRDMEYIHLKDMRASAFEPVNVLSGYRYQDGLGYYESTRDASTNFFISYLPKGTYVFEYKLVASQKGDFSNGITTAQCMYAPEFAAHSEGIRVKVE
ncbi:MAG TPA: alpha-2-macroglobulin family protein [Prolixibacteraceae bacterium]|nr:alpha-2-macroglobulin family protein [Prolixibacteraceae bacterium]